MRDGDRPGRSSRSDRDVMSEAGLAGKSQVPVLAAFLGVVAANRPRIRQGLRSAALGVSNLPSVQSVRASIDIRVGFEETTVAAAVPVAIIFIGTDAPERRLCSRQRKSNWNGSSLSFRRRSRECARLQAGLRVPLNRRSRMRFEAPVFTFWVSCIRRSVLPCIGTGSDVLSWRHLLYQRLGGCFL